MKRILLVIITMALLLPASIKADEGMWILPLISKLNINQIQEKGFKLSADDIYSINKSSLKDAVVIFGRGCTGELISDQGLILTNHHCGYGSIQSLSSVEHDYLEDGFWAATNNDELSAPGLTVTFLKRMEEVTDSVLKNVTTDMTETERNEKINLASREIEKKATEGNNYKALVKSFFAGNQYFLVIYETFTDVRLVGTPPSSIGKFGHDTDNWMWPRHTGDFSMFRVYSDPDGKPADYSAQNIPYKPAHYLPISLKGTPKSEFAMTIGYPGSTDRYITSWGIEERMNIINHSRIKPREIKRDIWHEDMMSSKKINIQYASKYAGSSNYWKNSIGMNKGLQQLHVLDSKRELEQQFGQWINADATRQQKYGEVLTGLKEAYQTGAELLMAKQFISECLLRGTELFGFARNLNDLKKALESKDNESIASAIEKLKPIAAEFYKDYSPSTDEKVMAALIKLYHNDIPAQFHPEFFSVIDSKFHKNYSAYAAYVFKKSFLANEQAFNLFLEKPSLKKLTNDPAFLASQSSYKTYYSISDELAKPSQNIERFNRLFQAGLMEMQPDKVFYPDANFTMRLSIGSVGDYSPADAVEYSYFTTLKGVIEKEDPNNWEFIVPAKLKDLYNSSDYGNYADADGTMHVCFTTNNDITGGNSGSPVINSNGELFGLAFDGNWEAMSGDIAFENRLQKCINVDIRYVLFIIDKFAGATHLIDEMTIVK